MGIGPISVVNKLLKQADWKFKNIELIEINEPFAAAYLEVEREFGLNREIVNVNGGAFVLGHLLNNTSCMIVVRFTR
jgi:acetyl-CoA acetyltransferase